MNKIIDAEKDEIKPFLKWAGGKRWLVAKYSSLLKTEFKRYYEPFLGSGAIFFHLQPDKALLADVNGELIDTYLAIKNDWSRVYQHLVAHHKKHSSDYYYKIRQQKTRNDYTKAARLIYLNRTCWNGLYRVNLNGAFNVPIGTKKNVISNEDDYAGIAGLLKNTLLLKCDFEDVINRSESEDFIFVDPPYTIKHNYNGFVKYNEDLFAWDDQIRLRDALVRASGRGVKFLMTNACHASVKELYEDHFEMIAVERSSVISGRSIGRGRYAELLIYSGIK